VTTDDPLRKLDPGKRIPPKAGRQKAWIAFVAVLGTVLLLVLLWTVAGMILGRKCSYRLGEVRRKLADLAEPGAAADPRGAEAYELVVLALEGLSESGAPRLELDEVAFGKPAEKGPGTLWNEWSGEFERAYTRMRPVLRYDEIARDPADRRNRLLSARYFCRVYALYEDPDHVSDKVALLLGMARRWRDDGTSWWSRCQAISEGLELLRRPLEVGEPIRPEDRSEIASVIAWLLEPEQVPAAVIQEVRMGVASVAGMERGTMDVWASADLIEEHGVDVPMRLPARNRWTTRPLFYLWAIRELDQMARWLDRIDEPWDAADRAGTPLAVRALIRVQAEAVRIRAALQLRQGEDPGEVVDPRTGNPARGSPRRLRRRGPAPDFVLRRLGNPVRAFVGHIVCAGFAPPASPPWPGSGLRPPPAREPRGGGTTEPGTLHQAERPAW
jgi:hypothetical protein